MEQKIQQVALTEKECLYLTVLLMEEIDRLENKEKPSVFHGVRLSTYMRLFEKFDQISK